MFISLVVEVLCEMSSSIENFASVNFEIFQKIFINQVVSYYNTVGVDVEYRVVFSFC